MSEWMPISDAPKNGTPVSLRYPDGTRSPAVWAFSPNANKTAWCWVEPVGGALLPYSEQDAIEFKFLPQPPKEEETKL